MYRILAPAPAGPASGHFWQIRPNPAPAKRLARFSGFSKTAVHVVYLQLKVKKSYE